MSDIAPNQNLQTQPAGTVASPLNRLTEHNIHVYSMQSRDAINRHIQELENEWSIERIIETAASVLAIVGIALGTFASPWFLILPAIICTFFLAHAVFRFCPALSMLQNRSTRTNCQINSETFAMKAMRSDDASLPADSDKAALADRIIVATRAYSSVN